MKINFLSLLDVIIIMMMLISCAKLSDTTEGSGSQLASLAVQNLDAPDYSSLQVQMVANTASTFTMAPQTVQRNSSAWPLSLKVPPGKYHVILNYFDPSGTMLYSADFCTGTNQNNTATLVAGPNTLSVRICQHNASPVGGSGMSDVTITPVLSSDGGSGGTNTVVNPPVVNTSSGGKKGIGMFKLSPSFAKNVGATWVYNWTANPWAGTDSNVEFVPMIWGTKDMGSVSGLQNSGYKTLLGFNEPDHSDQANMSVSQVISLWPQLMATGLRLGSPAPANPQWFGDFMAQIKAKNYRVDFLAVHTYPNIGDANAVNNLQTMLTNLHNQYGLPIWLTEFGACTYSGSYQQSDIDRFISAAIPMLNSLSFVERYSWFADSTYGSCPMTNIFSDNSGTLSQTGTDYKNADAGH